MKLHENEMVQPDMEPRLVDGEKPPLSLRRQEDCNKEHHCGEQHNSRAGGNIPVRGDKYSSN